MRNATRSSRMSPTKAGNASTSDIPRRPASTVSRVGLNREKDRALFYLACCRGALAAVGGLHVVEREGDVWVQPPVCIGSRWVS